MRQLKRGAMTTLAASEPAAASVIVAPDTGPTGGKGISRGIQRSLITVFCAISMMLTLATSASAATEVPCNSGPPEPIQLRVQDGGDICFGGLVGVESVGLPIAFMDAGGYYGYLFISTPDQCTILPFRPREVKAVNAVVCAVEITEPF